MTSLSQLIGTEVVARDTAEQVGAIAGVIVDVAVGRILGWQVGRGRRARVVDHQHVTGIGDAVVIDAEASLREPTAAEAGVVRGKGALLGSLVLADDGTALGTVDDVEVDTDGGALGVVTTSAGTVAPDRFRSLGTYALVVRG